MPRSGAALLKASLLVGALVITPLAVITTRINQTSAAPEKNICISAVWKDDSSISSYHGACPEDLDSSPVSNTTASSTPNPTAAISTPAASATPTASPATSSAATSTADPTPTASSDTDSESTASPIPSPTSASTSEPTPSVSPSSSPTISSTPTPVSTDPATSLPTASSTPVSSPTASPTPTVEPVPAIPAENTDPKTQSFRFCHNGGMLSNSYTGMMNGHHGRHPEDIIPPIPFKFYGGWNWNATNAKTFYNNCVPVS